MWMIGFFAASASFFRTSASRLRIVDSGPSSETNVSRASCMHTTSVVAVIVAIRGSELSSAISPKYSPAPSFSLIVSTRVDPCCVCVTRTLRS